jgi:hypothetical protein
LSMRYNSPPNWPRPPAGWTPPPGWRPEPSWGPAPPGWQFWVEDPTRSSRTPLPVTVQTPAQQSNNTGYAMVALAAGTCGFAGFVPPIWAARQRPHDAAFRRRMYAASGGLFALLVAGMIMVAAAEDDATGSPTGLLSDIGGSMLVINLIVAVTVAVLVRNTRPSTELPGVAEALSRRQLREQYRQLTISDPALARSIGVGRPDLPRNLDDGGLLDLNTIPLHNLGPHAGLSPAEAGRVAGAREQLGRFVSLDEVAIYADLPDSSVELLRERALFF